MRLGGRIQAAIEVMEDVQNRRRPIAEALKDWGLAHRFAGSGDRAVIGNLAYDALRWRASTRWIMDSDKASSLVFGTVVYRWNQSWQELETAFDGDKFAPVLPDADKRQAADARRLTDAPEWIQADLPKWLVPHFQSNFADGWIIEAKALCGRPPLDLRVNTLKSDRSTELAVLQSFGAELAEISSTGLRIPPSDAARRHPNIQVEESYQLGRVEIQDEASQIASELVYAQPGEIILDFCAGAGGKTLALAAAMKNTGKLYAYDNDRNRQSGIFERLQRAGADQTIVLKPDDGRLADLLGGCDRVVVDAPCTGSGTWRRKPDAKWRLTEKQLQARQEEQQIVLEEAAPFVRQEGFLIYMTCSVLAAENEDSVAGFLNGNPAFELVSAGEVWQDIYGFDKPQPWSADMMSITLTPASTATDGFYFAVMQKIS
uniref:RsmB/NOP family class I SAM-dependent RNA methyltransferase n=1 Tax=Pararhizobium sp. IMCC3301 TaxID=3067904 RepID=UPI002740888B|nr:RsmB/NOP family class I SAM-dependent RNA methyltransferase [Pararhizobium sp. IMCC3301]